MNRAGVMCKDIRSDRLDTEERDTSLYVYGCMCAGGAGPAQLRQFSTKQLSLQLQRSMSITADGRLVPDATWAQQQAEQQKMGTAEVLGCEQEFQQEVSCCCLLLPRALPPPSVVGWSVHPHAAGMAAVCWARQLQFTLVSPLPSILALQAQCALSEIHLWQCSIQPSSGQIPVN